MRLYNWTANHYGIVRHVLFTARDGAVLSGHVWATVAGAAERPGVVITNGSVQADEQMYWYAAQALAKADRDWLARIITRRVPLARWSEALEPRKSDIKVIIDFTL